MDVKSALGMQSPVRLLTLGAHVWIGRPPSVALAGSAPIVQAEGPQDADAVAIAAHFHGHMAASLRRALDNEASRALIGRGAAVLLDGSEEGYAFSPRSFAELHGVLGEAGIAPGRLVLATQNFALAPAYRAWAAAQGLPAPLRIAVHHHFLRLAAQEAAAALGRDGLRARLEAEIAAAGGSARPHRVLCLNHKARPHRLIAVGRLARLGILETSRVSFHGGGGGVWSDLARNLELARRHWPRHLDDIAAFEAMAGRLPLELDEPAPGTSRQRAFAAPHAPHFVQAALSLVTETEMGSAQVRRFTEKSVKPLAFGQLMLVLGPPRTLATLREYGFRTFGDVVDESYDELQDQASRLGAVLAEFDRVASLPPEDLGEVLRRASDTLAHNLSWFADGGLAGSLTAEDERLAQELRMARDDG